MNKNFTNKLFLASLSIFTLIVLMSNSSGRGNVFGQAVTGAPGDSNKTCASVGCHASGSFSPNAELNVVDADGNAVSSFIPGETYDVTLSVETSGNPNAFGFQMVALTADNSPATDWSDIGSNIQIVQLGDRDYIEHTSPSSANQFNTKWTAPNTGSGDVTFYFSANAVNGNGSPAGDGAVSSTFVLEESTTASIELLKETISIYPTPANEFITIAGEDLNYNYSLYSLNGQKILTSEFKSEITLDISKLEKGLYFIQLQNEDNFITKKIIIN